jgi:hypothetical protein
MKFTNPLYPDQIIEETDAERIAHMTTYGGWVEMPPEPEPPPPPPPVRKVWRSAADFWLSFTEAERLAVAACSEPQIKMLALTLGYWDSELHSDNSTVQAGMEALVSTGLLTRARANELLNPPGLQS